MSSVHAAMADGDTAETLGGTAEAIDDTEITIDSTAEIPECDTMAVVATAIIVYKGAIHLLRV